MLCSLVGYFAISPANIIIIIVVVLSASDVGNWEIMGIYVPQEDPT